MPGPKSNLTPWKKGQSGNPKGRPPKKICIPDILATIGNQEHIDEKGNKTTKREAILNKTFALALKGEQWAIKFIADRTEGKPKETLALELGQEFEDDTPAPVPASVVTRKRKRKRKGKEDSCDSSPKTTPSTGDKSK